MTAATTFKIIFAPEALGHVAAIDRKYHSLIQQAISEQLSRSPENETRNRKLIEQPAPFGATWELRFGLGNRFRVFYEVDHLERVVWVLAVGLKDRERLLIGGEEFVR